MTLPDIVNDTIREGEKMLRDMHDATTPIEAEIMNDTKRLKKVNKRIQKNLTGVNPDFVELGYLYRLRKYLAQKQEN